MIWFDIIIFGCVAAFLGWRLYSVLGERHGDERARGNPYDPVYRQKVERERQNALKQIKDQPLSDSSENVSDKDALPARDAPDGGNDAPVAPVSFKHAPDSLAGRLAAIEDADPNFEEKSFLAGVKGAFGMIVAAFAAEDTATLRPLLNDDVYDSFAEAIRQRQAAKEHLETRVLQIADVSIEDAVLQLNTARITVRIVSEQVQFMRNEAGDLISGDEKQSFEVVDLWTFSRNTRSLDPNWVLAETRPGE